MPARSQNISDKLASVVAFFNGEPDKADAEGHGESDLEEKFIDGLSKNNITRRCIMLTVCLPDNILSVESTVDSLEAL